MLQKNKLHLLWLKMVHLFSKWLNCSRRTSSHLNMCLLISLVLKFKLGSRQPSKWGLCWRWAHSQHPELQWSEKHSLVLPKCARMVIPTSSVLRILRWLYHILLTWNWFGNTFYWSDYWAQTNTKYIAFLQPEVSSHYSLGNNNLWWLRVFPQL